MTESEAGKDKIKIPNVTHLGPEEQADLLKDPFAEAHKRMCDVLKQILEEAKNPKKS